MVATTTMKVKSYVIVSTRSYWMWCALEANNKQHTIYTNIFKCRRDEYKIPATRRHMTYSLRRSTRIQHVRQRLQCIVLNALYNMYLRQLSLFLFLLLLLFAIIMILRIKRMICCVICVRVWDTHRSPWSSTYSGHIASSVVGGDWRHHTMSLPTSNDAFSLLSMPS